MVSLQFWCSLFIVSGESTELFLPSIFPARCSGGNRQKTGCPVSAGENTRLRVTPGASTDSFAQFRHSNSAAPALRS